MFTIVTLALLFSACSKDPASTLTAELVTTFKFTANGTVYELNGSLATNSSQGSIIRREGTLNTGQYYLSAQNGAARNTMVMALATGNMAATSYSFTYPTISGECELNQLSYYGDKAGDNTNVIVTSIHDGVYADGTFTGQMTRSGSVLKVLITNGEFKNVKILQ